MVQPLRHDVDAEDSTGGRGGDQQASKQVSLLNAQVGRDVSGDPSRLFAFSISSPEGTLELQAENAVEQAEWMAALQVMSVSITGLVSELELHR